MFFPCLVPAIRYILTPMHKADEIKAIVCVCVCVWGGGGVSRYACEIMC